MNTQYYSDKHIHSKREPNLFLYKRFLDFSNHSNPKVHKSFEFKDSHIFNCFVCVESSENKFKLINFISVKRIRQMPHKFQTTQPSLYLE